VGFGDDAIDQDDSGASGPVVRNQTSGIATKFPRRNQQDLGLGGARFVSSRGRWTAKGARDGHRVLAGEFCALSLRGIPLYRAGTIRTANQDQQTDNRQHCGPKASAPHEVLVSQKCGR
jgi:hypothetical protein